MCRLSGRLDRRHTAAVHLLESGVEVNVIRSWLGHELCLFRTVTIGVMSPQWLSVFQLNLASRSTCDAAGMA